MCCLSIHALQLSSLNSALGCKVPFFPHSFGQHVCSHGAVSRRSLLPSARCQEPGLSAPPASRDTRTSAGSGAPAPPGTQRGTKDSQVLLKKAVTEPNPPPSTLHQRCCHPYSSGTMSAGIEIPRWFYKQNAAFLVCRI